MKCVNYFFILNLLIGCASYVGDPKKLKHEGIVSNVIDASISKKLEIHATFKVGGAIRIASNRDIKSPVASHNEIINELEIYLGNSLREVNLSNLIVHFELTDELMQTSGSRVWSAASMLSIGIIPFWTRGETESKFSLFDLNRRKIKFMSYIGSYLYVQHLFMLPLIFKSQRDAAIYIAKMHIDNFVSELKTSKF